MSEVKKVWNKDGERLRLSNPSKEFSVLENAIYIIGLDDYGFYLSKKSDGYDFNYKIYGLESSFIDRTIKTYSLTDNNLGILLNGLKGTGNC